MVGIACDLKSPCLAALISSLKSIVGKAEPYAICGSLPLVDKLQLNGFDIQMIGFGLSARYHADNEYCLLSDMIRGGEICWKWIGMLALCIGKIYSLNHFVLCLVEVFSVAVSGVLCH